MPRQGAVVDDLHAKSKVVASSSMSNAVKENWAKSKEMDTEEGE